MYVYPPPQSGEAWQSLGLALLEQGRVQDAEFALRESLGLDPGNAAAHSDLLLSLNYTGRHSPEEIFAEHRAWNQRHAAPLAAEVRPHENAPHPDRRLRVGYVSPDFRAHPVVFFLGQALALHHRRDFAVHCYSNVARPDAVTEKLQGLAEAWRDIRPLNDPQAADLIRQDGIDVLVDLAGHTGDNRLLVFARRPAPVQVTWLGYPNTTGLAAIDYCLTDVWSDPPGRTERYHTEELVRLPSGAMCYLPVTDAPEVAEPPALRNEIGRAHV